MSKEDTQLMGNETKSLPKWVTNAGHRYSETVPNGGYWDQRGFEAGARLVLERLEKVEGVPPEPILRQLYRDFMAAYCAGRESVRREVLGE